MLPSITMTYSFPYREDAKYTKTYIPIFVSAT